jgi:hypothetical protein
MNAIRFTNVPSTAACFRACGRAGAGGFAGVVVAIAAASSEAPGAADAIFFFRSRRFAALAAARAFASVLAAANWLTSLGCDVFWIV